MIFPALPAIKALGLMMANVRSMVQRSPYSTWCLDGTLRELDTEAAKTNSRSYTMNRSNGNNPGSGSEMHGGCDPM